MDALRTSARRHRGFTTTELMIVVFIVGLLVAIAAPNLGGMVRAQRIKTAAFDLFASLTFARSEAIKRNNSVSLVNNGDWSAGWRVVDANNNVLREQSGWEQLSAAGPNEIRFSGTGRLSAAVQPVEFAATGYGGQVVRRCVTLDLSGRATVKDSAC